MTEEATEAADTPAAAENAGLRDALSYPFADVLRERRTRRVAQGTSIDGGEVGHDSHKAPSPLSPLEEAVLIARSGSPAR